MKPAERLARLRQLREQRDTLDGASLQLLDSLENAHHMWLRRLPAQLATARAKVRQLEADAIAHGLGRVIAEGVGR